jgi:hypothetical protein
VIKYRHSNSVSLGRIQRESQNGDFDMVLHVGDMAYNMVDVRNALFSKFHIFSRMEQSEMNL